MGGYESRDYADEGWDGDFSRMLEDWGWDGIYNSVFEFDVESGKIRWPNFDVDFSEYAASRWDG